MGCAHAPFSEKPRTVTSDIFPELMTRSEYYRQLAWGYDRDGKISEAIELYRLSLMHDPKNLQAKIQLSDAFRKEKLDHLASAQLSEVLSIDSDNILALKKLGDLYLTNQIYSKAALIYQELLRIDSADERAHWAIFYIRKLEVKYDVALKTLEKIENLVGNKDETLIRISFERAAIYRLQKNWQQELKYLESAYNLKPNLYSHVSLLSDSYFRFKNWIKASTILQRFTDTNDFNFEISEKLAYASIQTENYEVALREYAKQKPWIHDQYLLELKVAHVHFLMKDYSIAEQKYLALIQLRGEDEPKYYLSKVYQITDRHADSATLLDQLPPMSEYYGESQIELADYEKKNGNFNEAINRVRRAHLKRPDILAIYKSYADMLIENKRFVESVALLEQGVGFYPNDEELRFKLAFNHYRLNNQKSFKKQIAKAIQINPNNSEIYAGLAELWYAKDKKSTEVEFFVRKAMDLKSKNKNLKPLLAWALMEQQKSIEAIAVFEEYYEQNPDEYFYVKSLADIYRFGHVSSKAEAFSRVAVALDTDQGLKEKLLDQIQTKPAILDASDKNKSRMPASLENY